MGNQDERLVLEASLTLKPCARVEDGEVRAYMDDADEGKYVAVVVFDDEGSFHVV